MRPADVELGDGGISRAGGAVLIQPAIRVRSGDAKRWFDDHDAETLRVLQRIEFLPAPRAQCGATVQEKRHVGSQLRGQTQQTVTGLASGPDPIQAGQRGRRIGAAPAETCGCRNLLLELDMDITWIAV